MRAVAATADGLDLLVSPGRPGRGRAAARRRRGPRLRRAVDRLRPAAGRRRRGARARRPPWPPAATTGRSSSPRSTRPRCRWRCCSARRGPRFVAAISVDYPGSLLDVRHRRPDGLPEVEAALVLARAAGGALPAGRRRPAGASAGRCPPSATSCRPDPYVVLHPGASVPARALAPRTRARIVAALGDAGWPVLVTGGPGSARSPRGRPGGRGRGHARRASPPDLAGRTGLAELAAVLAGAACVVVGNTGPAHLAAAVGTPVVSLFSPVVPAERWAPYGVPIVLLGDQAAPCRGTRARECPVPGHPCLTGVAPAERGRGRAHPRAAPHGGGRMRILIWHVHGSWTTAFVQGGDEYLIPVVPDRGPDGRGRARTWNWPERGPRGHPGAAARGGLDVVVLQRPRELELLEAVDRAARRRRRAGGLRRAQRPAGAGGGHRAPAGRARRHPGRARHRLQRAHVGQRRRADHGHRARHAGPRATATPASARASASSSTSRCAAGGWPGTDLLLRLAATVPGRRVRHGRGGAGGAGAVAVRVPARRPAAGTRCTTSSPGAASTCTRTGGPRLGLSLIEAMQLGMPVLALATTDAPEAVPPAAGVVSSDPAALAVRRPAVAGRPRRRRRARPRPRARTRCDRYGLDRFLSDWERLLKEVTR